jgi:hypothetical protein
MVVAVTPGALAVLPAPDDGLVAAEPVAAVVAGDCPAADVVAVEELFDELLHAAAVNATAANTTAAPRTDQDLCILNPPVWRRWSSGNGLAAYCNSTGLKMVFRAELGGGGQACRR